MLDRDAVEKLIRESVERSKRARREYHLFGKTLISVKGNIFPNIDFEQIIKEVEDNMEPHLFEEVDYIFIGSFSENDERALEAHYKDGAIYITSDLPTNRDYVENIIHETAHAIEGQHGLSIYGDKKVEREFLGKRERLKYRIQAEQTGVPEIPPNIDFLAPEYSEDFDLFLYKGIGYEKLNNLTMGLFVSPYAATSLREYFANGFEEYFLGDREYLQKASLQLFIKIEEIILGEENEYF
tara:strand:- start:128 stop:847 length:720 start_codon:yes stop_codon:yes gene_type:complete